MSSHSLISDSPHMSLLPGSQNSYGSLGAFVLGPCTGDDFGVTSALSAAVGLKLDNLLGPSVGDDGRRAISSDVVTRRIDNLLGPCVGDDELCDRRLKRDIRAVDVLPNGLRLYSFRYRNDERTFIGIMAQDLLGSKTFSHAVHIGEGGYYTVDFSALGLEVLGDRESWRDAGCKALAEALSASF